MVPAVKAIYLALLVLVASSSFSSHHQQVKGDKYEDEDDYYDSRGKLICIFPRIGGIFLHQICPHSSGALFLWGVFSII